MNLIECYQEAVDRGEIVEDLNQKKIVYAMQKILLGLNKNKWLPWRKKEKGIYLYGPVGVGKTYLMDLLYQALPKEKKARFHFHHFMQQIDAQLRLIQGKKDPLRLIARNIAKQIHLLCFDEFLVLDVGTAMILAELLQALVREGVILLISSNTHPDELYLNGVQRPRFLPAIALLHRHCEILALSSTRDYRLGHEPLFDAYRSPLNEETRYAMESQFASFGQDIQKNGEICVQQRQIPFIKCTRRKIWFNFHVLCNLPRSSLDYLELADRFDVIFVSDLPCLTTAAVAQVILFIHFIDVMYDRGIQVYLSAAVPVEALYEQGEMQATFKRTLSRLIEMQAVDYLSRHPHRKLEYISHCGIAMPHDTFQTT